MALCLVLLALASLSEAALVRLDLGRARQLAAERPRRGRLVLTLAERRQEVLSSLIVLINLAVIVISAFTTSIAITLGGGSTHLVPIFSAGMIVFILIFCELTPKTFAVGRAGSIALLLAPVTHTLHLAARPVARLLHALGGGGESAPRRSPHRWPSDAALAGLHG